MNHVFLSYRQESREHANDVRRLGERLRAGGLPVALDQFFLQEQHPGGPDEGWRKWCEDRAEKSASVLIVCSKGWFDSYRKEGPPAEGLGAALEADIFAQAMYDTKGTNERVRLVILDDFDKEQIPVRLRTWHIFRPFSKDAEFDQMAKWIRQRLSMPGITGAPPKRVFLAECTSDMKKERKKLQVYLEETNWEVSTLLNEADDAKRQHFLEADMKNSVAFVQLLESYPEKYGLERRQNEVAKTLKRPCFLFRDGKILLDKDDPDHLTFLTPKNVILGSFDDFKQNVRDELEKIWHRQQNDPPCPKGLRRALVRVVVRSPRRDSLWLKIFEWIDQEPDIRSQLLPESENLLAKLDPDVPCHGYLIVCDSTAYASTPFAPDLEMEQCALIQLKVKDESRLPPAGLVYWPPPKPDWSKLQKVSPPKLHRLLGRSRPHVPDNLSQFFDDVRRAAQ